MKRLKNAKDEDNCCAEAEAEAESGEGEDKKGEKGLMVIMEDDCNQRCALCSRGSDKKGGGGDQDVENVHDD